jgi:hypothetical protein
LLLLLLKAALLLFIILMKKMKERTFLSFFSRSLFSFNSHCQARQQLLLLLLLNDVMTVLIYLIILFLIIYPTNVTPFEPLNKNNRSMETRLSREVLMNPCSCGMLLPQFLLVTMVNAAALSSGCCCCNSWRVHGSLRSSGCGNS